MKIAIIGQGYVGLTLSVGAISAGYKVIGFDSNIQLIQNLEIGNTNVPNIDSDFLINSVESKCFIPTNNSKLIWL